MNRAKIGMSTQDILDRFEKASVKGYVKIPSVQEVTINFYDELVEEGILSVLREPSYSVYVLKKKDKN